MSRLNGLLLIVLLLVGCVNESPRAMRIQSNTLYDRLGGRSAISAVVDQFVANCAADARINGFFSATADDPARLTRFKNNLVDQICDLSGGPCSYKGLNMKQAHRNMKLTNDHFDALVEDLGAALNKLKVGKPEQDQLLSVLEPLRADIVEIHS